MKKKIFKALSIALTIVIVAVCGISPASADTRLVKYDKTVSSYPGQQECYGESTIYFDQADVSTYCALAAAQKYVYAECKYLNSNYVTVYYDDFNSTSFNGQNYYCTVSLEPPNVLIMQRTRSQHRVQLPSPSSIVWWYFDPYLDEIGDYDNPDYYNFYVFA